MLDEDFGYFRCGVGNADQGLRGNEPATAVSAGFGTGGDGSFVEDLYLTHALARLHEVQDLHVASPVGAEDLQASRGHHEHARNPVPLLEDPLAILKAPQLRQEHQLLRN